jgi:hypothetical protein
MSLIVEDGSGLSTAESYVALESFKAYCNNRGYVYAGQSDAVLEQKLRTAADYIDSRWRFKGTRLVSTQALEFPRANLIDQSGFVVTGIARRLTTATCELAFLAISQSLYENLSRGGGVASESVGPISTSYFSGAREDTKFSYAENMLTPYIMTNGREFMAATVAASVGSTYAADPAGYFTLGGMSNGEVVDGEV